jgi:hypothetical protein
MVGEVTSWSRDFNDAYAETEDFTRIMDLHLKGKMVSIYGDDFFIKKISWGNTSSIVLKRRFPNPTR